MDRRAKRRRTAVNYAKLASGDFDDNEDEEEKRERDAPGSPQEEEEEEQEPVRPPVVTKLRRKPLRVESTHEPEPAVNKWEKEKEKERGKEKEKGREREREREKEKGKEKEREKEKEKGKGKLLEKSSSRSRKKRQVMSDSEEEEEDFGVDNDESEDFVPRKVKGLSGYVEEDDHVLDDDDQDLREAEREAQEEARKARRPQVVSKAGALGAPKGNTAMERRPSLNKNSGMVAPKPAPRVMVAPALSRSLSSGRALPSPSSSMLKGAQGRLLKKIGFKAPLVAASTVHKELGLHRQKSFHKNEAPSEVHLDNRTGGFATTGAGKGGTKPLKDSPHAKPWFLTPGSGKWDRKSTALLDDAALFSGVHRSPGAGPAAANGGPADPELPLAGDRQDLTITDREDLFAQDGAALLADAAADAADADAAVALDRHESMDSAAGRGGEGSGDGAGAELWDKEGGQEGSVEEKEGRQEGTVEEKEGGQELPGPPVVNGVGPTHHSGEGVQEVNGPDEEDGEFLDGNNSRLERADKAEALVGVQGM